MFCKGRRRLWSQVEDIDREAMMRFFSPDLPQKRKEKRERKDLSRQSPTGLGVGVGWPLPGYNKELLLLCLPLGCTLAVRMLGLESSLLVWVREREKVCACVCVFTMHARVCACLHHPRQSFQTSIILTICWPQTTSSPHPILLPPYLPFHFLGISPPPASFSSRSFRRTEGTSSSPAELSRLQRQFARIFLPP